MRPLATMGEIQCSRSGIFVGDSARSAPVSPSNARSFPLPACPIEFVPSPHATTSAGAWLPLAALLAVAMGEPAPPWSAHQPPASFGGLPGITLMVARSETEEQKDPLSDVSATYPPLLVEYAAIAPSTQSVVADSMCATSPPIPPRFVRSTRYASLVLPM